MVGLALVSVRSTCQKKPSSIVYLFSGPLPTLYSIHERLKSPSWMFNRVFCSNQGTKYPLQIQYYFLNYNKIIFSFFKNITTLYFWPQSYQWVFDFVKIFSVGFFD